MQPRLEFVNHTTVILQFSNAYDMTPSGMIYIIPKSIKKTAITLPSCDWRLTTGVGCFEDGNCFVGLADCGDCLAALGQLASSKHYRYWKMYTLHHSKLGASH